MFSGIKEPGILPLTVLVTDNNSRHEVEQGQLRGLLVELDAASFNRFYFVLWSLYQITELIYLPIGTSKEKAEILDLTHSR